MSFLPAIRCAVAAMALLFSAIAMRYATAMEVQPNAPAIPNRAFNILEHGAHADGKSPSTEAIQKTIDAADAAGGGRVIISAGNFVCGPITLRSKIDLHLEKGAKLLMSQNFDDFPVVAGNRRQSFIAGSGLTDVRISGEGEIDGQGDPWWKAFLKVKGSPDTGPRRPQLIGIEKTERIELEGFTTLNPPNTHCSLKDAKDIRIKNLKMSAPEESPNTDALNLSSVQNVLVTGCNISTGDDNIVLLCSGENDPTNPKVKNVVIRDCKLGAGHGLSIGSFTSGGVQSVLAENIDFDKTTSGIRLKSSRERGGGLVKDLTYRHMTMKNVRYPISIMSYNPKPPKGPSEDLPANGKTSIPEWRDILIEDITISGSPNSIIIWGLPDKKAEHLTLRNVKVSADQGAVVFHADVTFSDVKINAASGPVLRVYDAKVEGMHGELFQGNFQAK